MVPFHFPGLNLRGAREKGSLCPIPINFNVSLVEVSSFPVLPVFYDFYRVNLKNVIFLKILGK